MAYYFHAQYVAISPEDRLQDPTEFLADDSADSYNKRAGVRRSKGRFEAAVADHDEAIARDPKNVDLQRSKAITCYQQGDLVGAGNAYLAAADIFEESGDLQSASSMRRMISVGLPPSSSSRPED
jgi:tetratricopeptide (TPR) repeat protein